MKFKIGQRVFLSAEYSAVPSEILVGKIKEVKSETNSYVVSYFCPLDQRKETMLVPASGLVPIPKNATEDQIKATKNILENLDL